MCRSLGSLIVIGEAEMVVRIEWKGKMELIA